MIFKSLKLIANELNAYLNSIETQDDDLVVLGNVAQLDTSATDASSLNNKIVLTLINLDEEKTLKNVPHYTKEKFQTIYHNPPVPLNLFLLFSITSTSYENALKYLSRIIAFFQGKKLFTHLNTPVDSLLGEMGKFKIILDLYSPTFEESNYLWSTLGGKQLPSALYKMRLIEIERTQPQEIRPVISEITGILNGL